MLITFLFSFLHIVLCLSYYLPFFPFSLKFGVCVCVCVCVCVLVCVCSNLAAPDSVFGTLGGKPGPGKELHIIPSVLGEVEKIHCHLVSLIPFRRKLSSLEDYFCKL